MNATNTTSSTFIDDDPDRPLFTGAIAFFIAGAITLLATVLIWIVLCKRHRTRAVSLENTELTARPLPNAPSIEVEESGAYIEFGKSIDQSLGGSINRYERVGGPGLTVPRDMTHGAMHETFDGSRMPSQPPPSPPTDTMRNSDTVNGCDKEAKDRSEVSMYEDMDKDNRRGFESTYEHPLKAVGVARDRPPTLPDRRPVSKQ